MKKPKKKPEGRPVGYRKPDAKHSTIGIRISQDARRMIEEAAMAEGQTITKWIWGAILARFARVAIDLKPKAKP